MVDEKSNILYESGEKTAVNIGFDAHFPVQVTENMMYSVTDYITEIGSRLSIYMAIVAFVSQRILYPVFTKQLGKKLVSKDLGVREFQKVDVESGDKSTDENDMRTNLVNKYLNWVTILR